MVSYVRLARFAALSLSLSLIYKTQSQAIQHNRCIKKITLNVVCSFGVSMFQARKLSISLSAFHLSRLTLTLTHCIRFRLSFGLALWDAESVCVCVYGVI